jgi:AbrB family looped-hinge helix DNA binding protein
MAFSNGKMAFMNAVAEIDKSGRLVVPKKMRDSLHLVAGTRVTLRQEGGEIVIAPETKPRGLFMKNGILVYDAGPLPTLQDRDWVQECRDERDEMLMGINSDPNPTK